MRVRRLRLPVVPLLGGLLLALLAQGGTLWQGRAPAQAQTQSGAQILSPSPTGMLPGPTVTFTWSTVSSNTYYLIVGKTQGTNFYGSYGPLSTTSQTVTGLPSTGATVWVRLESLVYSQYVVYDYQYVSWDGVLQVSGVSPATGTPSGAARLR